MKVLIVRVGAMGDVLHALPAVAALHRERPNWQIDWAVDTRWSPLLIGPDGSGPIIHSVHSVDTRQWKHHPLTIETLRSIGGLRGKLRAAHYDLAIDMQGTIRSAIIGRMASSTSLAGFADPRERMARRFYRKTIVRSGVHVVEQQLALLSEATGVRFNADATLSLLPTDARADAWADATLQRLFTGGARFCFMAPRSGWGAKQWPAANFGVVAAELQKHGIRTLVNAVVDADDIARTVVAASSGAATAISSSFSELKSLVSRSALFIGGDSGPTHLAAALGIPLIALYGPTDPARNGPWGNGAMRILRNESSITSHKRVEAIDRGLAQIEVSEVLAAAKQLLSGR